MFYVFAWIWAPHLGQVISMRPFPIGTRQIVLQFLQVKYLCSLSARRAAAFLRPRLIHHVKFNHHWFYALRL